jgi:hypothetical protein
MIFMTIMSWIMFFMLGILVGRIWTWNRSFKLFNNCNRCRMWYFILFCPKGLCINCERELHTLEHISNPNERRI